MFEALQRRFGQASVRRAVVTEYAPLPVIRTSVEDRLSEEEQLDEYRVLSDPRLPGPVPTAAQALVLRRVPAKLSWTTYAIAMVELAERASFYGVVSICSNFIQRPLPAGGSGTGAPPLGTEETSGALGLGLQWTTTLTVIFSVLGYTTPLFGGALADMYFGRYSTIMLGAVLVTVSHLVIIYAAQPTLLQEGRALVPFLLAMLLLSSSTGLIKANIAPLMAEQYTPPDDYVETLTTGETVIIDRAATIQKVMSSYYASINVGAFMAIASSFAEKYVGWWLAFLIPGVICFVMPFLLVCIKPFLLPSPPPSASALHQMWNALSIGGPRKGLSYDESPMVDDDGETQKTTLEDEAKSILDVCKFFLFFAVYGIADGGLSSLYTSLAGSMTTSGIPNDLLGYANPLSLIISIPLLHKYLYPFLRDRGIPCGPVRRVVAGFILAGLAMLWSALLQALVYDTSPCGYHATICDIGTGVSPLGAWISLPTPILLGVSESLAMVSAVELAYAMSPLINALRLFTVSLASLLVLCLVPLMHDPLLAAPFVIAASAVFAAAWGVWKMFAHLDGEKPSD